MSTKPKMAKWKRRSLIVLASILLLLAVISIMADRIIDGIVRNALDETELTFYGIDYLLEVEDINTSILDRSVAMIDVRFLPKDTSGLDQEKDTVQLKIGFDKLKLDNMDLSQLLAQDSLEIGHIIVKGAVVEVFVNTDYLDPDDLQFVPNVKEIFSRNQVDRLTAEDALVRVKVKERGDIHRTFIESMDLRIDAPTTLPTDSLGRERFIFDHLNLESDNLLMDLDNGYRFQSGKLSVNSSDSTIHIAEMDFRPKNGTPKVSPGVVRTIDWLFVSASDLYAHGFDMLDFMHRDGFQAESVLLKNPHLSFYQSFYVPDSIAAAKSKRLPGTIMKDLKMRFCIDKLELTNGLIEYEEVYDTIAEPIQVAVREMNLVLKNFTPRRELLEQNDDLQIEFAANILDSVKVRASINIPVLSNTASFTVEAHVDSLDFTMFNPIMEANRLKFKSGFMHSLDMTFTGDLSRSTGTMDMDYSDLHIQYLKGKKVLPIRLTQHNMLVSFLFNKIVRNNNSKAKKNFRQGVINVQRDPSANFLIYIYESTVAGSISSMTGIDDSMADRFPEKKVKSKKELRKENREQKKEARKNKKS